MNVNEATIFDIQRYTVHDGPGIRTAIFFKGCPLNCLWCSNPEGISGVLEIGVYANDCIGVAQCGWCISACPGRDSNLIDVRDGKVAGIRRNACLEDCVACAEACPNNSLRVFGRSYSVSELMRVIVADRSYYERSAGGVTLGGGDPLFQWQFVADLLRECRRYRIHTCVESELHCSREAIDAVLPHTDLILTDIKHMDPLLHRRYTGHSNVTILTNIKYIVEHEKDVVIRMPVVPGFNDDEEAVEAVAQFVVEELGNRIMQLQLLPYRVLGKEKYEALGVPYPMGDMKQPPREQYEPNIRRIADVLRSYGVPAVPGTDTKF
jgi:pyruvate formate lyase activating enzyme